MSEQTASHSARRTLMLVHAHPDDEVFGGGTSARYASEGARVVLVTATKGEMGEVLDPDLNVERDKPRLAEIREGELRRAVEALGISQLEFLGYRDSGMVGWPANEDPRSFNQADVDEATGRLVALIRRYQPQVLVTYNEDGGYGHPDHLMTHRVTAAAFDSAGDADRYPDAGEPWTPAKLYALAWSREAMREMWRRLREAGVRWPFQSDDAPRDQPPDWGQPEDSISTRIAVAPYFDQMHRAMLSHRSQFTPRGWWPDASIDLLRELYTTDCYVLLRSRVPTTTPETDLFSGVEA